MHRGMYIYIYHATLQADIVRCIYPLPRRRVFVFGGITMADKKLTPREQAFIVVFEKSFNPDMTVDEIVASAGEVETVKISEKAASLCREIESNLDGIDSVIESHLRGWSKSRISKVALAALRLGVYELEFAPAKAPVGVIISEAVGICRTYGSDEDKSFVNGVLGAVSRAHE